MTTSGEIVCDFLDRWAVSLDEIEAAFNDVFLPDAIWDAVNIVTTTGPAQSAAAVREYAREMGFVRMGHDMVNFADDGDHVYTERVDRFLDEHDNEVIGMRVFGVFDLNDDGKITGWREYFDSRVLDAFWPDGQAGNLEITG